MADKNNYLSRVTYKGGKDSYEFPFSYLRKDFVKAQIDVSEHESNTLAYLVDYTIDGHTIKLTKPVDADKTITIYRKTSSTPLVEYKDSSILRAYDLNLSQCQYLNILEEQMDNVRNNAEDITINVDNVKKADMATTADSLKETLDRPASANVTYNDGKIRYFLATNSMSEGKPPGGDGPVIHLSWDVPLWESQIAINIPSGHIQTRAQDSGTWGNWKTILDSDNFNNYAPTKTGGGASGTWDINISGNANNADTVDGYHASDIINKISEANTGGIVAASLNANGYVKFANGLIIQWGFVDVGGTKTVTFPIAFPAACFAVIYSYLRGFRIASTYKAINEVNKTSFQIVTGDSSAYWLAIGI